MNPDVIVDLMMGVEITPSTGDTRAEEGDLTATGKPSAMRSTPSKQDEFTL